MLELHLVRHTSVDVAPGICYGQTDVPLSPTFEQEALEVMSQIKDTRYDGVYSSPLSRCTCLSAYCGYTDPILDDRLMEMNFGKWEGIHWDDNLDPRLSSWFGNWIEERTTGGESFRDLCIRAALFIDDLLKHKDQKLLKFTHAGFIRATWVTLERVAPNQAFNQKVAYGQRVVFTL